MNKPTPESLNATFAIADHLSFVTGPGGLPVAEIVNAHGKASISLYGGHVLSYQPDGHLPVLWRSAKSNYEIGKPIRGGIPVCWPWFGPHPDESKPLHGFVRTSMWSVLATEITPDGATRIKLGICSSDTTRAIWEHAFNLQITVTLGAELQIELRAENTGDQPFTCTGALHSYFAIGNISDIGVAGFDKGTYLDRLIGEEKTQIGAIKFTGETDRAYLNTTTPAVIEDANLGRNIIVAKSGSRSTVVWNPGEAKAKKIADFGDEEYIKMVCIEPANINFSDIARINIDPVTIAPGQSHSLAITIRATAV